MSGCKAPDGPATNLKTSLPVEELKRCARCLYGKERLANSHSPFVPVRPKGSGRDLVFMCPMGETFNVQRRTLNLQISPKHPFHWMFGVEC